MVHKVYDYSKIGKNYTDRIVEMVKKTLESGPAELELIVDNQEEYLYNRTKKDYQESGYKIVRIALNDVRSSDQYAMLMDFFSLMDKKTEDVNIASIASFLARVFVCNFKDGAVSAEWPDAVRVMSGFLNRAYLRGNVNFTDLLSRLIEKGLVVDIVKKINISCEEILCGYDFSFEDLNKKDLVIYIIPPDRKDAEGKSFLIPIILYLFRLYSDFVDKTEVVIADVIDIGVVPFVEMLDIAEWMRDEKNDYLIGYNGRQYSNGDICQSSKHLISMVE